MKVSGILIDRGAFPVEGEIVELFENQLIIKTAVSDEAGAAIGGTIAAGGVIGASPGLRLSIKPALETMLSSKKKIQYANPNASNIPKAAIRKADKVAKKLLKSGFDPKKHSLAISAAGGTGKSTLAALLKERLGMGVIEESGKWGFGRQLPRNLQSGKVLVKPGKIYEQSHILTMTNPNKFDAVVHMHRPTSDVLKGLRVRKRGALQMETMNYPKIKKMLSSAYETLGGKNVRIGKGVEFKLKPLEGFKSTEKLDDAIRKIGLNPSKMDRERKIVTAIKGHKPLLSRLTSLKLRKKFPNLMRYDINYGRIGGWLGALGAGAFLGSKLLGGKSKGKEAKVASLLEGIQKQAVLDIAIPAAYGYYGHGSGRKISDTAIRGALLGGGINTLSSISDIMRGKADINTAVDPLKGLFHGSLGAMGGHSILPLLLGKLKGLNYSEARKRAVLESKRLLKKMDDIADVMEVNT